MTDQERILVYGSAGSGKTYSWLSLARANKEVSFHCIDTDASVPRMLNTEFRDLLNVEVYPARKWDKLEIALALIEQKAHKEDWLVVDMICSCWDFAQAHFVEQIFGKKIDDYYMEARKNLKQGKQLQAIGGWDGWSVINKFYQDWTNRICYDLPYNVFLAAKSVSLTTSDDQEVKDIFESIGAKPEGEKRNHYRVHTVLYFAHTIDKYLMTTAKDRGRKKFFAEPVIDFAKQYGEIMRGGDAEPQITS